MVPVRQLLLHHAHYFPVNEFDTITISLDLLARYAAELLRVRTVTRRNRVHFLDAVVAEGLVREHERGSVDASKTEGSREAGGATAEDQGIIDPGRGM